MLGRTISNGTTLTYKPSNDRMISITSVQFGQTSFLIDDEIDRNHWARYAQAAAHVFGDRLFCGMYANVDGPLSGTGLSSSASVGLACLLALANVNDIDLSPTELVQLDYQLENSHLGLMNGVLDPMTIVYGVKDALLFIDADKASIVPIHDGLDNKSAWIVAYSGVSRELTKSGFNIRVVECHEAARILKEGARRLCEVPDETFEERKEQPPLNLRHRAEHFFSEVDRVRKGARAWKARDLELFGALMNQSCHSSIINYESGSSILIQLHEIASSTTGIFGSRFSGGGYAGCVVALADRELAENARLEIAERFSRQYPKLNPFIFIAETGGGLQ